MTKKTRNTENVNTNNVENTVVNTPEQWAEVIKLAQANCATINAKLAEVRVEYDAAQDAVKSAIANMAEAIVGSLPVSAELKIRIVAETLAKHGVSIAPNAPNKAGRIRSTKSTRRTMVVVDGTWREYKSAKAACEELKLEVNGDAATRVLIRNEYGVAQWDDTEAKWVLHSEIPDDTLVDLPALP